MEYICIISFCLLFLTTQYMTLYTYRILLWRGVAPNIHCDNTHMNTRQLFKACHFNCIHASRSLEHCLSLCLVIEDGMVAPWIRLRRHGDSWTWLVISTQTLGQLWLAMASEIDLAQKDMEPLDEPHIRWEILRWSNVKTCLLVSTSVKLLGMLCF